MAAILDSVPETLYETLFEVVETEAPSKGAAAAATAATTMPPVAAIAVNWTLMLRVFVALLVVIYLWRKLGTRRPRKIAS